MYRLVDGERDCGRRLRPRTSDTNEPYQTPVQCNQFMQIIHGMELDLYKLAIMNGNIIDIISGFNRTILYVYMYKYICIT